MSDEYKTQESDGVEVESCDDEGQVTEEVVEEAVAEETTGYQIDDSKLSSIESNLDKALASEDVQRVDQLFNLAVKEAYGACLISEVDKSDFRDSDGEVKKAAVYVKKRGKTAIYIPAIYDEEGPEGFSEDQERVFRKIKGVKMHSGRLWSQLNLQDLNKVKNNPFFKGKTDLIPIAQAVVDAEDNNNDPTVFDQGVVGRYQIVDKDQRGNEGVVNFEVRTERNKTGTILVVQPRGAAGSFHKFADLDCYFHLVDCVFGERPPYVPGPNGVRLRHFAKQFCDLVRKSVLNS